MKRAKSIQEWVACTVAVAVKSQRIQDLEEQLEKTKATNCRYDQLFQKEQSQNRFKCPVCAEWFDNIDAALCEGGCDPTCQSCESRYFCDECRALKCDDCILVCPINPIDCRYLLCVVCAEDDAVFGKHECPQTAK